MTASLKALGNHRIDTRLLALDRKLRTADHVHHLDTVLMEEGSKALGTTRRGNHDRHMLLDDDLDQRINLRVEQWHINPKRSIRSLTATGYMFAQHLRVHRASPQEAQSPRIAHSRGQSPTATPDHTARNDRVAYA